MYILVLQPLPSPTRREGGMLNVLFKTIEKSIAYPQAWVQSLYPETRQAWSFLESLELPNRLRACSIISTPVFLGKSIIQNRDYKLPVG